jgi:predicted SAM-dependent methyltransferase
MIFPKYIWRSLRWEILLTLRLIVQSCSPKYYISLFRIRSRDCLRLNLGCFYTGREGWINIDAVPSPSVDFIGDLRKPLILKSGSVECIFCEHVFEHLHPEEHAGNFLKECLRVLQPGGVLRIIVPDAEKYCDAYLKKDWAYAASLRDPGKFKTLMELLNDVFRQDGQHLYAYDEETLRLFLTQVGFTEITKNEFFETRFEGLALEQSWRKNESLHMEGIKPKA